jgi:hypothetical protein
MKFKSYVLLFLPLLLISCRTNPLDIDVSEQNVELELNRFDIDFAALSDSLSKQRNAKLKRKYGDFYFRFLKDITGLGAPGDPMIQESIKKYINDPHIKIITEDVASKYPDLEGFRVNLENAFKYYKYYFPDKLIPEVTTFVSGFQYKVVALDSVLGISLDMYLGPNYANYELAQLPKYITNQTNEYNMLPDAIRGWIATEFILNKKSDISFLDRITHEGKLLYLMDAMLKDTGDSLKIGYSQTQMEFCDQNEFMIWAHFLEQSLLHETLEAKYDTYLREGPFTTGLPTESPSRIGQWVGWQIVKKYMESNPEVRIKELFELQDGKLLLSRSKYKPTK